MSNSPKLLLCPVTETTCGIDLVLIVWTNIMMQKIVEEIADDADKVLDPILGK